MVNAETRAVYARAVVSAARARDPRIEAAFAAVPRERFLGPPPWKIVGSTGALEDCADPAALYQDVLVAIDPARGINNGEPQLWAFVFDRLEIRPGDRVLHIGTGTGYYTAILAELVGPTGSIIGLEAEPDLAERARAALVDRPQAQVLAADRVDPSELPFDRIVFSCGVTHLPPAWLDGQGPGSRIAAPFTGADHAGVFLLLVRAPACFEVTPLSGVAIFPATGFRDPREERLLDGVRRADPEALWKIRSLRPAAETTPAERLYGFQGHVMSAKSSVR
ncbi:protein-L-isoaspartate O-methyltransferase family protein [Geminicoccus roseus]|uniref:protein-L-isoaspartate O-methyltransferase family protein n=1 Tax=Geminicoccus roseus TaxID=404900 RepID=UPI0006868A37|nr:methyltransferase domain-containing protein [Geminicoccus roseus]